MVRLADYKGMDRQTGQWVSGLDHLRQSVADIITTRLRTRWFNPKYGCKIISKLGAPMNAQTVAEIIGDIALAIDELEPRLDATYIKILEFKAGKMGLSISGKTIEGTIVQLDFPALDFGH